MKFNTLNRKKLNYDDQIWIQENTPLFKSSELESADI